MQNLEKHFKKAGLPLEVTNESFVRGVSNKEIFQMTIEGSKHQQFKIFEGVGSDVQVVDADSRKKQVLLSVKEPKRRFTERVWSSEKHRYIEVPRETEPELRRYLAGMDERHLFISELPKGQGKINTVEDAHKKLKPYEVKDRKKRKGSKTDRQGEWFFTEATAKELELIEEKKLAVENKVSLPTRGNPHTVDEHLKIGEEIFIRGNVRHQDHKTLKFSTWQRVFKNTEIESNFHGWVD